MTDLSVVKHWGRETYSALDKGQKTDRTNNMKSLKRLLLNARGMVPYNKIWKELHLLKMGRIKLNLTFTLSSYKNLNWLKGLRSFLHNFSQFEASEITVKCKNWRFVLELVQTRQFYADGKVLFMTQSAGCPDFWGVLLKNWSDNNSIWMNKSLFFSFFLFLTFRICSVSSTFAILKPAILKIILRTYCLSKLTSSFDICDCTIRNWAIRNTLSIYSSQH